MKKILFLVLILSLFSFFWLSAEPAEAQGIGLRCDTPHCRYAPYDRGGRWYGDRYYDGRHDYSPYVPYPDSVYGRDGFTIVNPAPGTTLKIEKKGGGLICLGGLLSIFGCGEETVDFSTAPAAGQQTQAKPQTQGAQAYVTPAPPVKEETLP